MSPIGPHTSGGTGTLSKSEITARERRELERWERQASPVPSVGQRVTLLGKIGALGKHSNKPLEESQEVIGLIGTEGITVTAGYGKWTKVARMQRTALTVLEDYEPYAIDLPLILDVQASRPVNKAGEESSDIEEYVNRMEWMGGRGSLFKNAPGKPGEGETPIIAISSAGSLVPNWMQQGKEGGEILWVIEKLEYNTMGREWVLPIRHEKTGRRIRQALNVSLLEYSGAPNAHYDSQANRVRILQTQSQKMELFTVEGGVNTFLRIAKHYLGSAEHSRIPDAARELQKVNAKYGASITKILPHGAKIRVPESVTKRRF